MERSTGNRRGDAFSNIKEIEMAGPGDQFDLVAEGEEI